MATIQVRVGDEVIIGHIGPIDCCVLGSDRILTKIRYGWVHYPEHLSAQAQALAKTLDVWSNSNIYKSMKLSEFVESATNLNVESSSIG